MQHIVKLYSQTHQDSNDMFIQKHEKTLKNSSLKYPFSLSGFNTLLKVKRLNGILHCKRLESIPLDKVKKNCASYTNDVLLHS